MDEIIYASATSIAQAIRDKRVSATEVVEAHLQRIAAVNPTLNAVVQSVGPRARLEALAADQALARGELRGPLHGVPMTIKDSLDTAGVISTGGTKGRATLVPEQDATVVARLRAAGAILLGKTNTPELTLSGETDNLVYGRTNNPYDVSHSRREQWRGRSYSCLRWLGTGYWQRHWRQYSSPSPLLWHCWHQAHLWAGTQNWASCHLAWVQWMR